MSRGPLLLTAAAAALGSGACCLVMLLAYAQTSPAAATWWALAGFGQLVLSAALLRSPSRRLLVAGAAWSGVLVAVWLLCRACGLGPRDVLWQPVDTAVGFTDVVHAAIQGLAAALLGIAAARWPRRRVRSPLRVSLAAAPPLLVVTAARTLGAG